MSVVTPLENKELPETCCVYKHSTTCPLSAAAAREVEAASIDIPVFKIDVRVQRELSAWVAQRYAVEHESPQLILIRAGKAEKVWNHGDIRREKIEGIAGVTPSGRTG
jgi:bacillithiol system protein YtxJ